MSRWPDGKLVTHERAFTVQRPVQSACLPTHDNVHYLTHHGAGRYVDARLNRDQVEC
jgi:hypothetical protein